MAPRAASAERKVAGDPIRPPDIVEGSTRRGTPAAPHVTGVVALAWQRSLAAGLLLDPEAIRTTLRSTADRIGVVPLDSPTTGYTFDGAREGIVWAPGVAP